MKRFVLMTTLACGLLFGCEPDVEPAPVDQAVEFPTAQEDLKTPNELGIDYTAIYKDNYIDMGVNKTVDKPLPEVVLPDLEGEEHDLADLIGDPMIIEFASTTCVYCQQMEPVMEAFKADNPDVHVVQIYDLEQPDVVKTAMKGKDDGILRLVGEQAVVSEMFESYYTPTMYYVDNAGVVRMLSVGTLTQEEIELNIAKIQSLTKPE